MMMSVRTNVSVKLIESFSPLFTSRVEKSAVETRSTNPLETCSDVLSVTAVISWMNLKRPLSSRYALVASRM